LILDFFPSKIFGTFFIFLDKFDIGYCGAKANFLDPSKCAAWSQDSESSVCCLMWDDA